MSGTVNAVEFITGMQILCIPVFLFVRRRLGRGEILISLTDIIIWARDGQSPPNYV